MDPVRSNTGGPVPSGAIPRQQLRSNELWVKVGKDKMAIGMALREELKKTSNSGHRKRLRTAELNQGTGPSHRVAEAEYWDDVEPPDTRRAKGRKITMERKTEDKAATQRGEARELRAQWTSARMKNLSEPDNQGLREETLVAPPPGEEFALHSHRGRLQGQPWAPLSLRTKLGRGQRGVNASPKGRKKCSKKLRRWSHLMVLEGGVGSALDRRSSTIARCGGTVRRCMNATGGNTHYILTSRMRGEVD